MDFKLDIIQVVTVMYAMVMIIAFGYALVNSKKQELMINSILIGFLLLGLFGSVGRVLTIW